MENNQEEQIIKRVITGREMLQRKINSQELEIKWIREMQGFSKADLTELEKRVKECRTLSEFTELSDKINDKIASLKHSLDHHDSPHKTTQIETSEYSSSKSFPYKLDKVLEDTLNKFENLLKKLDSKEITNNDFRGFKSLESNVPEEVLKNIFDYLASKKVIKGEFDHFVFAFNGIKNFNGNEFKPLKLAKSKRIILVAFLNLFFKSNPSYLNSAISKREFYRRAGELFIWEDSLLPIGTIRDYSQKDFQNNQYAIEAAEFASKLF